MSDPNLSRDAASKEAAFRFSERSMRTQDPPISWLMKLTIEDPEIISLAAGFVDQPSLPDGLMKGLFEELFSEGEAARSALQYGMTQGHPPLRRVMAKRLAEKNGLAGPIDPESILITNGSQQLLHLVTDSLVNPGDIVLLEDPTYFVYLGVLEPVGARVMGVATDENGMIPEALEERLKALKRSGDLDRLKILYVMSYYQNPMGVSIAEDRRKKIVEIAAHYGGEAGRFLLLEDAAYRELRFDGPDLPYLKAFDPENRWIALTGTFSKAFAPGLRLGWGMLPHSLMRMVLRLKGNEDFGSSNLNQHLLTLALERGIYDRQMTHVAKRYLGKRDLLLDAVRRYWPAEVQCLIPHGGLYVWVTLPEGISTAPGSPLFNECLARKVIYVPSSYCYCQEPGVKKPVNRARLCYGFIEEDAMVEGVRRMGEAIASVLEGPNSVPAAVEAGTSSGCCAHQKKSR